MKHFYSQIKNFLNIALFLGIFMQSYLASSQTTLSVGDIIFTGYDATATPSVSTSDSYSFVLLVPISANTVISFTDRGYNGSTWQAIVGNTEATVTWTSATAIPLGTEILISGLTASTYNPTTLALTQNGVVTVTEGTPANGLSLSTVGDQIVAFQGGSGSITGSGVSLKGGLSYATCNAATTTAATWDVPGATCTIGPSTSAMPPGIANGTSAFYTGTLAGGAVPQSAKFTGTGPFANAAAIKTAVMNPANWSFSATTQTMPSGAPFLGVPPTITANPPNRTLCVGGSTTLPITASNATSFQWQVDTGSGFANLSNAAPYSTVTTATLTITNVTAAMSGYLYRCVVTGVGTINSNSATLTVPNTTVTTTSLTNVSCNGGNNGSVTVAASGGIPPYTYLWSPSGITSATAGSLPAGSYTVTVTDNIGCPKIYPVTISEPTLAASSPSVSSQPAAYTACAGSTATFSVTATNTVTYQWQVDDGSGYTNITNGGITPSYSGANTTNLNIGSVTTGMNGYSYRVVLTSSCTNSIVSNGVAQLSVTPLPVATATPSSQTICSGSSLGIALTSAPTGASFAWTATLTSGTVSGYSASSGTTINQTLTGNGVVTYTVTPTLNSCPGAPITVAVTVKPLPIVTSIPSSQTVCSGSSTNIALISTPTGATFSWTTATATGTVNGASGSSGTTIAQTLTGNGTVNYTVTPTLNGCPGPPSIITVTVNPLPTATATPASKIICSGTAPNIALTSTPTGAAFSWTTALTSGTVTGFSDSSGTSLNQVLSGDGVVTYTVTPLINSCPGNPITIPITVLGLTSITTHPSLSAICVGSNATFSAIASNATSYQWQENTGSGYSNLSNSSIYSGATTATLTITGATTAMNGNSYRVIATGTCAPAAVSNGATLTIYNIIANPTQVNVSCNGGNTGSATVTPSGGTGSYTYLWSTGATTQTLSNLTQGNYSVTINDANLCPTSQSFTITEPAVLVAAQNTFVNPNCNGGTNGSATVAASGGTLPYTYSWSPSGGTGITASGLSDGTYTVTVTDGKGCTATQAFTLVEPTPFAVTTSQTDVLCNGAPTGAAAVTVSGATGPYTYSWAPAGGSNNTASGLTAGTYTVTITDSHTCSTTRSFTIWEPAALVATVGSTTDVDCYGFATGSATVNVTGGVGTYSYSWAPSGGTAATASGLTAGTYTVTVTDANSCSTTQTFTINQPTFAISATTSSTGVSCFGGANGTASVTASGGTGAYSYSWAPSGGTGSTASGLTAGDYDCTITDAKGCTLTKTINVGSPTQLTATIAPTNVSCNGGTNGSASVTASGGTGTYTYIWSPTGGNAATATGLAAGTYTVTVTDANSCTVSEPITITEPAVLTVTPSQTDVLCNGGASGTATVTATGGTGTYTYAWSPSGGTAATATGLNIGNYSCLVTDGNGCSFTQNFLITEPPVLTASISKIDATCLVGGQSTVSASGGTTPYSYSWSPSGGTAATATGLSAGSYTVTITDGKGCTTTQSATINTTNTLVAATSQTDVLCNSANTGSASVTPSGAPGPFTYVWSPSGGNANTASNLTAGSYNVTITSANGCSIVKNFTIIEPAALVVTPSQIDLLCNGATTGEASVSVTGGTGAYTYLWAPSGGSANTATGLSAGTYTVTIKDANLCQTTQSFTITEPSALTATITPTNISCNGGTTGAATVTATGGVGTYTYAWAPSGGTAATATGLTAGTYTVTVTDANSCTTTQTVTLTEPAQLVASAGSQIDVTCNGFNNGSATVNVTGGSGTYSYVWAPSGGTAATATGLSPGTYIVTVTDANSCTTTQNFTITEPTLLTAAITGQTNILCNGQANGAATVTATGGNGTYTYAWAPSGGNAATATGLSPGTYTVTVTDTNSCTATQSVTITEPSALTATIAPTNISCNGGTTGAATVTATGGNGTYTYAWAPSGGTAATATGLTAGTYTVTVTDANSCTTTQTVTLTEPAQLVASAGSQTDVTCNGFNNGSATVNVTGGSGTYSYVWAPSGGTAATATGLSPGTYIVTVTDANSCTTTQNFTITEPTLLTAAITGQTNILCNGQANGAATVTATGGNGTYAYAWTPSGGNAATATGLSPGTYTVTVTDTNSCTATQSVTITEPSALTATIAPTNVSCNGGTTGAATVTATGGNGTYTYAWAPSGGTAATATGLTAGTYTVTVTDANSCTTTQTVTLTEPSQLVASAGSQIDVTCNGLNNGSATVNVTGGSGTYSYVWAPSGGTAATATGLSPGTYIVTVTDANSCTATQNFIITEPTLLTAAITGQTNILCNGQANGAATVTATGGNGTYAYAWSPSGGNAATATGLSPGTYTVTVTDAKSCTATQSVTITEPGALTATIAPTNISCNGGTTGAATVTAIGGAGTYTYAWTPSGGTAATATGLTAGTYTVTVTDANSCTTTQTVTLTEPALLTASITAHTNVSCYGASNGSATVSAIGGTGTYTYIWGPSGGTAATATGLNGGTYTVTITDTNNCTTTQTVTITEPIILAATTTQTNVTCGANNGSATVAATGGTGLYTYAWSPSGGNAATATGLSAGNYTVTITDAKGCTIIKSISILTTPDVTAPVPNLATLPTITSNCSILSAQISVPTATDNCAGIINATTTNPLNYTTVGTYVITWSYDDGHGNISTQNQTLNVTASPLNLVTFSDAQFTYNGSLSTLQVANLPAGATVAYAITPITGTANGATNAGVYSITATVTPSVSTPNCSPITLTAQLTIKKAAQLITFGALPVKTLGGTNTFNLAAIANSGLAIRYSFTSPTALPAANVSATTGLVNLLRPGSILITAHQDGDANYLAAPDVSQLLIVKNNDITIAKITIGNQVFLTPAKNANIKYVMLCDENNPSVSILNETNATIFPSANFSVNTPKPGIYTQIITVTSEDGSTTSNYTITVEKPFGFFDIVRQKFNNVLLVNNNPLTNGGYEFVSYEWFKNGQSIGTGQYYTAGNALGTTLDPTADYSVKMTTKDGKVLQTCKSKISLSKSAEAKLYPNPIQVGKTITVEADFPVEELASMQISLYSVSGQLIKTVKSSTIQTEIELPQAESSMYIVVIETANIKKTLKVIVNK
ncbi:T9SS type A sorting domain-containing protein [Flavobacterium pectinovorum]|uniref:T9SS C-terminal target domain-containing protein n=1 Tax=Flavobacterium pectinovorum TaxID=29533 RepID=A0A502ESK7_9FLAO|nr:T9SS type A sorting domain-containing protein [Flavobacterium pectinovorum]TPG40845.1 T9SS C-terminal target domain-containing protein [Flavobacterium pectinovorum]